MTVVIGVDPSSKKVACILTGGDGPPSAWTVSMKSQDAVVRCAEAYNAVSVYIDGVTEEYPFEDIYVFIEEPVVGRGGAYATIVQSKVHGAIVAALHNSQVCTSIKGVNNSTCKKKVVGKGNASKPQIKAWVNQYWRQAYAVASNGKDQDLLDAAMINRYGHGVVAMLARINKTRKTAPPKKKQLRKLRKIA